MRGRLGWSFTYPHRRLRATRLPPDAHVEHGGRGRPALGRGGPGDELLRRGPQRNRVPNRVPTSADSTARTGRVPYERRLYRANQPPDDPIIIRVSGVRVPPPASL